MKRMLTMIAVLGMMATVAMAVLPKGDTDDTNMPVYYYISSTTVGIASDSYAQRTLYDFEDKWGFDPINMGFS
ncbi:MAG: hypothetical protein AB1297_08000, partial [bacterium]